MIYGHGGHVGIVTWTIWTNFRSHPHEAPQEIWLQSASKEKKLGNVESEWPWTKVNEWPWPLIFINLGHVTRTIWINFCSPIPWRRLQSAQWFQEMFEYVDIHTTYGRQRPTYSISSPVSLQLRWANKHSIIMILSFRTDRAGQTVQTQIRLLLEFTIPAASFGCISLW